ncbi:alpha/beta hydrolase [Nocardia sp. NPDC059246]|uniref:alpha/beta hydrolase n=1 Tax=unclassified Nocardia TaxID=2637762 RepID=UPI003692349E
MAFTFPIDAQELIDERAAQWIGQGVQPGVVQQVRGRITNMWLDGPGGWAHEWSAAATQAEQDSDPLSAALLYGVAKFPVLADDSHRRAYDNQLRTYLAAAEHLPVAFERHSVDVPFRASSVPVATHLYQPTDLPDDAPLVLALSGVDTWKVELHRTAVGAAQAVRARIATVDMAGTGESLVPNGPDGELYLVGVIDWLRKRFPASRKVGAIGFSFGGHWTTKLALTRRVDAAVSIGGLVEAAFSAENVTALRFGMAGIFGNSLRLDVAPSPAQLVETMASFSLRTQGLLDNWGADPIPLLSVNGDLDQHVPTADTTVLEDRPNTIARLVPGASHCAAERLGDLMPWILDWLRAELS